jgi:hypothetical protein
MSPDIPFYNIHLDVSDNTHMQRKAHDVLTNLGLRLGRQFVQTPTADHQITHTADAWIWRVAGVTSDRLSAAFQAAVDIFDFKHLQPDPGFPNRPTLVGYDPRHAFLDETFATIGADLNLAPPPDTTNVKPKIIVQITHDVDNPQLLTPYQLARSFALLLRGRRAELSVLKAAVRALIAWSTGQASREAVDPFWCFGKIHDLGQHYGFRSTFFTHAQYPTRHARDPRYKVSHAQYQAVLSELAHQGHEIGLHSGINFNDFRTTREALPTDPIRSHRAHYWAAPPHDLEQWYDTMAQAGISGDASISPQKIGYALGSLYPVMFTTQSGHAIVLYPSQFMDAYHLKERTEDYILNPVTDAQMSAHGQAHGVLPVINLNWHVRTFSGIGPWAGYDTAFTSLVDTLTTRFNVTFQTVDQSTVSFKKALHEVKFTS